MKNKFTHDQRDLLLTLMAWFWDTFNQRGLLNFGVNIEDFDFMYSLWKNNVFSYDTKIQKRLNSIRDIYLTLKDT